MKNKKFTFRHARPQDVIGLVSLEENAWKGNAASAEMLASRINTFPEGNIIALLNNNIVGYVAFEYCDNVALLGDFSWNEVTSNGFIVDSHKPQGEYIYGINLSVHRSMSGQNLSFGLTLQVWSHMIRKNKRGVFLGARMPGFRNYHKNNPNISAKEYVEIKRQGRLRDPELRMYQKDGFCIISVIPNYFPDPSSENYGVLLYRKNPFYNWPFRRLWYGIIASVPISFREKISIAKVEEIKK